MLFRSPPKAKIKGNEKFFRSAGGGNAEILMEDDSISDDGDQHERIWNITGDCQGIENRSFQTNRKVAIKKKRVGKAVVTLKIKDKWKEETLEEYVTDKERLSSEVNKNVEVDNKAPDHRDGLLRPRRGRRARVARRGHGPAPALRGDARCLAQRGLEGLHPRLRHRSIRQRSLPFFFLLL